MPDFLDGFASSHAPTRLDERGRAVAEVVARVHRANAFVNAATVPVLRAGPLSLTEMFTLSYLAHEPSGSLSHTEIAEHTFTSTSTITNRIDRLEERGLVRRAPHPDDRRAMLVVITSEGRAALREASKTASRVYDILLATLSLQDLEQANDGLRTLLMALESRAEAAPYGATEPVASPSLSAADATG